MRKWLLLGRLPTALVSALTLAGCMTTTSATSVILQMTERACADPLFWPDWKPSRSDTAMTIESQTASRAGREAFCDGK